MKTTVKIALMGFLVLGCNLQLKEQNLTNLRNWFFAFIAFTLGLTLFKHIDFKNFTFKDPALDILYLIVLYYLFTF